MGRSILQSLYAVNPSSVSKVVDANGEPLVVWHGSHWDPLAEEPGKAVFDAGRAQEASAWPTANLGFYFTSDASFGGDGYFQTPVFLNIREPLREHYANMAEFDYAWKRYAGGAKDEARDRAYTGSDGLVIDADRDGNDHPGAVTWFVAKSPTQIKSATDNAGVFSERPDVRYSVTPAEDAAYMDAVRRGDYGKAVEMLVARAKEVYGDELVTDADGDPIVFFHGAKARHNVLDPNADKNGFGDVYLTDDPSYADRFGGVRHAVILAVKNPSLHNWAQEGFKNALLSRYAGHDAAFIEGVMDFTGIEHNEVLVRNAESMKEAAVTYDDAGNVIPLSQRFNTERDDIRYSVGAAQGERDFAALVASPGKTADYARRHGLRGRRKAEMDALHAAAALFARETRDLYARLFAGDAGAGDWARAFASPEANRGQFPTVSRVIAEQFTRPEGFGAAVKGLQIRSAEDVAAMMMALRSPYQEMMKAVYVDAGGKVLDARIVSIGSLSSAPVHPRDIFANVPEGATGIYLSHNHPSADPTPSREDFALTVRLRQGAQVLGLEVKDHVITDGERYHSVLDGREYTLPARRQSHEAWETGPAGVQLRSVSDMADFVRLVRQDGKKPVVIGLDAKLCVETVRILPQDALRGMTPEGARAVFGGIAGVSSFVVYAPDEITGGEQRAMQGVAAALGVPLLDIVYAAGADAIASMRAEGRMERYGDAPGADAAADALSGQRAGTPWRYSVGTRALDWEALPNLAPRVASSTGIGALEGSRFKEERGRVMPRYDEAKRLREAGDETKADAILSGLEDEARALAADKRTEWLGKYLLGKYHADTGAAKEVVKHYLKPEAVAELKAALDPSRPVVALFPLTNVEGKSLNRLPFAYAGELARRLDARVDLHLQKKTSQTLTRKGQNERASADFEFDTAEIDFSDNPQIIIVDDTWTSGQTTVSAVDAILRAHPDADIRAVTALAAGRYGKNVKPAQGQLTKVLKKSTFPTVDALNAFLGYDIRRATGSELHGYVLNGRSGPDGIRERFGSSAPGVVSEATGGSRGDNGGTGSALRGGSGGEVASRYSIAPTSDFNITLADPDIMLRAIIAADELAGRNRTGEDYARLGRILGSAENHIDARAKAEEYLQRRRNSRRRALADILCDMTQKRLMDNAMLLFDSGMEEGEQIGKASERAIQKARRSVVREATETSHDDLVSETGLDLVRSIIDVEPDTFAPVEERPEEKPAEGAPDPEKFVGPPTAEEFARRERAIAAQDELRQIKLNRLLLDLEDARAKDAEARRRREQDRHFNNAGKGAGGANAQAAEGEAGDAAEGEAGAGDGSQGKGAPDAEKFNPFVPTPEMLRRNGIDVADAHDLALLFAAYIDRWIKQTPSEGPLAREDRAARFAKSMKTMLRQFVHDGLDPTEGALLQALQLKIGQIEDAMPRRSVIVRAERILG
ncbi:MAG: hypothetical protein IJS46_02195, partial [Kiritimatiellae bacterium]|nr:hypothetical protein [Kiritimatiellia bacterium]